MTPVRFDFRIFKRGLLVCLVLGLPAGGSTAVLDAGAAAFPILATGVGARGTAMGDSYVALVDDASALFWNPGAMGRLQRPILQTDFHHLPLGGHDQVFAGASPIQNLGVLGCDLTYRDYGSQDGYDAQGHPTESFQPCDLSAGVGWGISLSPVVSVGARALWFHQGAAGYHETGLVENVGVLLGPWKRIRLGASLKNMGLDSNGFSPPAEMNLGMVLESQGKQGDRHRFNTALGVDFREHHQHRFNLGVEYSYRKAFFLRMGWAPRWDDNELGDLQGFTSGVGFSKSDWSLDVSLSSQAELGWEQRLTLSWLPPWKGSLNPTRAGADKGRVMTPNPMGEEPPRKIGKTMPFEQGISDQADRRRLPPMVGEEPLSVPMINEKSATLSAPVAPGRSEDAVVLKFQVMEEEDLNGTPNQLYQRGEKNMARGETDHALSCYQKCVDKDPGFEKAWIRISQIQYQKALEAARNALKTHPNNESLKSWLNRH